MYLPSLNRQLLWLLLAGKGCTHPSLSGKGLKLHNLKFCPREIAFPIISWGTGIDA